MLGLQCKMCRGELRIDLTHLEAATKVARLIGWREYNEGLICPPCVNRLRQARGSSRLE